MHAIDDATVTTKRHTGPVPHSSARGINLQDQRRRPARLSRRCPNQDRQRSSNPRHRLAPTAHNPSKPWPENDAYAAVDLVQDHQGRRLEHTRIFHSELGVLAEVEHCLDDDDRTCTCATDALAVICGRLAAFDHEQGSPITQIPDRPLQELAIISNERRCCFQMALPIRRGPARRRKRCRNRDRAASPMPHDQSLSPNQDTRHLKLGQKRQYWPDQAAGLATNSSGSTFPSEGAHNAWLLCSTPQPIERWWRYRILLVARGRQCRSRDRESAWPWRSGWQ